MTELCQSALSPEFFPKLSPAARSYLQPLEAVSDLQMVRVSPAAAQARPALPCVRISDRSHAAAGKASMAARSETSALRRRPASAAAAAAGPRAAHGACAAAGAQAEAAAPISGFKVATFSAQPYVLDYLEDSLRGAVADPAANLRVRPPALCGPRVQLRGGLWGCMAGALRAGNCGSDAPGACCPACELPCMRACAGCGWARRPRAAADLPLPPARGPTGPPQFIEARLDRTTAELAHGCDAICVFVNDCCDAEASVLICVFGQTEKECREEEAQGAGVGRYRRVSAAACLPCCRLGACCLPAADGCCPRPSHAGCSPAHPAPALYSHPHHH